MVSKKMQKALNRQIQAELQASYLYLSMSTAATALDLEGTAHWMRLQSEEERGHAIRLVDHLQDLDGEVEFHSLDQPDSGFHSALEVFQKALESERKVTSMIHEIYSLAVKEGNYATQVEMQWFVQEQVHEERDVDMIIARLKMAGDDSTTLFLIDRELGQRQ